MSIERGPGRPPAEEPNKQEPDALSSWIAFVNDLDEETRKSAAFGRIEKEADDSDDYKLGLEKLQKLVARRRDALEGITIRRAETGR